VISQAAGFTPGWINVTNQNGQRAIEHFGGRQGRLLEPHVAVVEETAERLTLGLTVPPHIGSGYVDQVIRQQKGQVERMQRGAAPLQWATANLTVNVDDLASLTAKVALGTGAMRWGDVFLLSDLGEWLRHGIENAAALALLGPPAGPATDGVSSVLNSVLAHYVATKATAWRSPVPSMTILTPVDHGAATVVTLVLFGVVMSSFGNNFPKPGATSPIVHFHPARAPEEFNQ
jgi:hypothetical protein